MWWSDGVPLPPDDLLRIERWVAARYAEIGEHLNQMRIEFLVSRNAVTIVESRPPWDGDANDEWVQ